MQSVLDNEMINNKNLLLLSVWKDNKFKRKITMFFRFLLEITLIFQIDIARTEN